MDNMIPKKDDGIEDIMVKNILHVLAGQSIEICIACLIKCTQALVIGLAKDKQQARTFLKKINAHLKEQIEAQPDFEFGALNTEGSNDPILHDRKKKRS